MSPMKIKIILAVCALMTLISGCATLAREDACDATKYPPLIIASLVDTDPAARSMTFELRATQKSTLVVSRISLEQSLLSFKLGDLNGAAIRLVHDQSLMAPSFSLENLQQSVVIPPDPIPYRVVVPSSHQVVMERDGTRAAGNLPEMREIAFGSVLSLIRPPIDNELFRQRDPVGWCLMGNVSTRASATVADFARQPMTDSKPAE